MVQWYIAMIASDLLCMLCGQFDLSHKMSWKGRESASGLHVFDYFSSENKPVLV